MISHRMLSNEICGNGLKDRVTACRKRLRVNRVARRVQVNSDAEELFPEITSVSRLDDQAARNSQECLTMPATVVCMNYRSPFVGGERGESGTLVSVGEQEVGIT